MNKDQLCQAIIELIDPNTTPNPDEYSDGAILDMIHDLAESELQKEEVKLHKALAKAFAQDVMTAGQMADFIAIYRGFK